MLTSPRERRGSPLSRLKSWVRKKSLSQISSVGSETGFRFEIHKERSRVDRRPTPDCFALILIDGLDPDTAGQHIDWFGEIQSRLRITDSLGWCNRRLGVLLPETNREGGRIVANQLQQTGRDYGLALETDIFVYPDDDEVAHNAVEFGLQRLRLERDPDVQTPGEAVSGNGHPAVDSVNGALRADPLQGASQFSVAGPTPRWKRAIDIVGSLAGLVLLSPIFLIAAIAIRLTSEGPIFFRQLREGKDGLPFHIHKFRTMCVDAEMQKESYRGQNQQDGPAFKIEADPRLTTIGRYLRKSCIDELPQLINVLRGEMSLVGPRPLPVGESLGCRIWQRRRLEVVPGVTCIWQVRGNHHTRFDDWMRMDMEYIRRRSLLFDMQLIAETIYATVLHRGSV